MEMSILQLWQPLHSRRFRVSKRFGGLGTSGAGLSIGFAEIAATPAQTNNPLPCRYSFANQRTPVHFQRLRNCEYPTLDQLRDFRDQR
jgi:hypothetical protein